MKKSKPRFYPDINMQKLIIWMLGKYDEFGEYLDSDTSKKILESFFDWILCLIMPVLASDKSFFKFDKRQPNLSSFTSNKQKLYFYIFTFQVKSDKLHLDIF